MLKTLDQIGIPDAAYSQAGVSRYAESDPYSLIPETPWWRLLDRVALREGIPDLGLVVGQGIPFPQVRSLVPGLTGARTLLELLRNLCFHSSRQASHADFRLVEEADGSIWLRDEGPPLLEDPVGGVQIRLFRVLGMIQVVQTVLGKQWRPRRILAVCSYNRSIDTAAALGAESVIYEQPYWAIQLDRETLNAPLLAPADGGNSAAAGVWRPGEPSFPEDFTDSVKVLIAYYLSGGHVDVHYVARESGMPVRTLQRRLMEADTSFSALLLETRLECASRLLSSTDTALGDVAYALGYSDYSKFSRTFKRRTGLTPNQFRRVALP